MAVVGSAEIELKSGSADGFTRDATRKLDSSKGKFTRAGETAGDGFSGGFSKEAGSKLSNSAAGLAKKIAVVLGGAFAIRSGINQVTKALEAADESRKIGAQTEAVIKSTGAAANVSAAEVDKLTTALSLKTGVDDEAIQAGENLLLTFTNIRNEAGKGNDIFNQSTQTLVDLAAAMGTEPKAAAVQLGKALNDPTKGITALTKVGVTFTQQQRDQIAAMQASGDMAGAQKVILAELSKEFGGSAEAQASAMDKIKVAAGNLQETFGAAILPAVQQLLPVITDVFDRIAPVLVTLADQIAQVFVTLGPSIETLAAIVGPIIEAIGGALVELAPAVQPLIGAIGSIVDAFVPLLPIAAGILGGILEAVAPIIRAFGRNLGPIVESVGAIMLRLFDALAPVIDDLAGTFVDLIDVVGPVLVDLLDAFVPIIPVVAEIASAIGGVLADAVTTLAPVFVDLVSTLVDSLGPILPVIAEAFLAVVDALAPLIPVLIDAIAPVLPIIADAFVAVVNAMVPLLPVITQLAQVLAAGMADVLVQLAPSVGELAVALSDMLVALVPILVPLLKLATLLLEKLTPVVIGALVSTFESMATVLALIAGVVTTVSNAISGVDWAGFLTSAGEAVSGIVGFITELPGKVGAAASGLFSAVVEEAKALPGQVGEWISALPGVLTENAAAMALTAASFGLSIIEGLISGLGGMADKVGDVASTIIDSIKGLAEGLVNGLIDALNSLLPDEIGKVEVAGYTVFDGIDLPDNPIPQVKFARGGLVRARSGGVLANIAEAGYDELVLSTDPAMADRNRSLIAQAGLAGPGATTSGPGWSVNVESMEITTPRDGRGHAIEFLEQLATEAFLAGAPS